MEYRSICKKINEEIVDIYKKYAEYFRPIWLDYKNAYINLLLSVYNSDAFQNNADKKYTTYYTADLVIEILCSKFRQRLVSVFKNAFPMKDRLSTQNEYAELKYERLAENKEIKTLVDKLTNCREKLCSELNLLANEPDINFGINVFDIVDDVIVFGFGNGMGCDYCAHSVLKFMKYVAEDTTEDPLINIKI